MEIITLLKANIRRKKGSFISVILLTLIIVMSVSTVLSIKDSAVKGVYEAHKLCDTPDLSVFYSDYWLADDIVETVTNDYRVESVNVIDFILINKALMNDKEFHNIMFLLKSDENTKLLKEDLSGIAESTPILKKGEIYVSQGLLTNLNGNVGDKIALETIEGNYEFTVKGILLDPILGSSMIGYNRCYISDEDYWEIYSNVANAETENLHGLGKDIEIKKAADCPLTNVQFRRQLNLDTGITDMSIGSIPREMSINYTVLFVEVITSVLLVFAVLLLAIVVIVTIHSISAEIETDYVTFGVLKSQGFDNNKIRLLFLAQYLMAEIIGAVLGIVLSVPVISVSSNIFVPITAVPSVLDIPAAAVGIIILSLFMLSAVFIILITRKTGKISPVRAISGAKREIYFDSRIKAHISKRLLSPSLALRQFTSAKRRYIGTLIIVIVLVFFMTTVTILANTINSKSALESMGEMVAEIQISPKQELSDSDYKNIEGEIERFTPIITAYYSNNSYFSFDGEEMLGCVYKDPSLLPTLKGRAPIYDNEISVSPILLDEFNLKIGDLVNIGYKNQKETYIISGTVQFMNDAGRCFLISYSAAERIGCSYWLWGSYSVEMGDDEELIERAAASLNEKYGDMVDVYASSNILDDATNTAVKAIQLIIYVFSMLFSLIVVYMVCSKAFIQERTDIGIFKAVGFGTSNLRLQFAVRFLIVSAIGSVFGGILSYFLSGKMLGLLLRSIGLTSFNTDVLLTSFITPILIICLCFTAFSYIASGKIRKVKIRELVTE